MSNSVLKVLAIALLSALVSSSVHECLLGVRIHPFKYVGATESVELKLDFKSNCMDFTSRNFFILPYNRDFSLSGSVHPYKVALDIFGRGYELTFSNQAGQGSNILYGKVKVLPSKQADKISTLKGNSILLRTSSTNTFTKDEVNSLYYKKNPCLCKLSKSKKTMFCQI